MAYFYARAQYELLVLVLEIPPGFKFYAHVVTRSYSSRLFLSALACGYVLTLSFSLFPSFPSSHPPSLLFLFPLFPSLLQARSTGLCCWGLLRSTTSGPWLPRGIFGEGKCPHGLPYRAREQQEQVFNWFACIVCRYFLIPSLPFPFFPFCSFSKYYWQRP